MFYNYSTYNQKLLALAPEREHKIPLFFVLGRCSFFSKLIRIFPLMSLRYKVFTHLVLDDKEMRKETKISGSYIDEHICIRLRKKYLQLWGNGDKVIAAV